MFSIGDAFTWAWNKFRQNAMPFVVASLIYGVVITAINSLVYLINPGTVVSNFENDYVIWDVTNMGPATWTVLIISYIALYTLIAFAEAAFVTACLDVADGKPVTLGSFFQPRNPGMAVLAALLVGVITTAGFALCFLPGLIVSVLMQFTVPFVVDRWQPALQGLRSSFSTVSSNIGPALLTWLVGVAAAIAGFVTLGIGLLVAVPIAALVTIYAYRKLTGGQVVALEQPGYQPGPPPGPPSA